MNQPLVCSTLRPEREISSGRFRGHTVSRARDNLILPFKHDCLPSGSSSHRHIMTRQRDSETSRQRDGESARRRLLSESPYPRTNTGPHDPAARLTERQPAALVAYTCYPSGNHRRPRCHSSDDPLLRLPLAHADLSPHPGEALEYRAEEKPGSWRRLVTCRRSRRGADAFCHHPESAACNWLLSDLSDSRTHRPSLLGPTELGTRSPVALGRSNLGSHCLRRRTRPGLIRAIHPHLGVTCQVICASSLPVRERELVRGIDYWMRRSPWLGRLLSPPCLARSSTNRAPREH